MHLDGCRCRFLDVKASTRQTELRLVNASSIQPHQHHRQINKKAVRVLVTPAGNGGILGQGFQFDL